MIARIPSVRIGPIAGQVAICIVAQAGAVEHALRVVGVVRRAAPARHIGRQRYRPEATGSARPPSVRIVRIGQVAEIRRRTRAAPAGAIGDRRHPRVVVAC